MKRCPNCNQNFGDEYDFCLNDGTPLIIDAGGHRPIVIELPDEVPTQTISRPQNIIPPASAAPVRGSNGFLYVIIGVLATALVAVGFYAFLIRDNRKQTDVAGGVSPTPSSTVSAIPSAATAPTLPNSPSPTPQTSPASMPVETPSPTKPLPTVERERPPSGNFAGRLSYANGSVFSARADLTIADDGQVRGHIDWTLLRTSNPNKIAKIGSSATEFVQGTFDPVTKTLSLDGVNKSDPADMIILDKYRLKMSADGHRLIGYSIGSRNRGSLILER